MKNVQAPRASATFVWRYASPIPTQMVLAEQRLFQTEKFDSRDFNQIDINEKDDSLKKMRSAMKEQNWDIFPAASNQLHPRFFLIFIALNAGAILSQRHSNLIAAFSEADTFQALDLLADAPIPQTTGLYWTIDVVIAIFKRCSFVSIGRVAATLSSMLPIPLKMCKKLTEMRISECVPRDVYYWDQIRIELEPTRFFAQRVYVLSNPVVQTRKQAKADNEIVSSNREETVEQNHQTIPSVKYDQVPIMSQASEDGEETFAIPMPRIRESSPPQKLPSNTLQELAQSLKILKSQSLASSKPILNRRFPINQLGEAI